MGDGAGCTGRHLGVSLKLSGRQFPIQDRGFWFIKKKGRNGNFCQILAATYHLLGLDGMIPQRSSFWTNGGAWKPSYQCWSLFGFPDGFNDHRTKEMGYLDTLIHQNLCMPLSSTVRHWKCKGGVNVTLLCAMTRVKLLLLPKVILLRMELNARGTMSVIRNEDSENYR